MCTIVSLNLHGQNSPNIIFLFFDDLNIAGTTFGGDPQVETPNFQRLADMGVNFTNAHSNSTICSPSRASVFTGLYPHTSGYYGYNMGENFYYLNSVLNSVDDMFVHFKNNGYGVYGSGKIYHSAQYLYEDSFTDFGFFLPAGPYVSIPGNPQVGFHTHPSMPSGFSSFVDGIAPLSDIPTFGNYTGWVNRDGTPFFYENDSVRDKLVDELTLDYGLDVLANSDENTSVFLTLGIQRPHSPFYLPKKYFDMYPISEIVLPEILEDDLDDVPVAFMNNRWNSCGGTDGFQALLEASADSSDQQWWLKRYMQGYYAGISFVDDLVGQLLDSLESHNLLDNTYIILTSDHGYHLGEKSMIRKTTLYDVSTRIPLIIAGPQMAKGTICPFPVSLIDIYPTIVDLAGIPAPDYQFDGFSLQQFLRTPHLPNWGGNDYVISHVASDERLVPGMEALPLHQHHSVRTIDKRYTLYATGEEEFYDHLIDPNEWFNLAGDSQYELEQKTLKIKLLNSLGIADDVQEFYPQRCFYHGGFEQKFNGWKMGPGNFNQVNIVSDGNQTEGDYYVRMNSNGSTTMNNKNLLLENGTKYSVTFDAKTNNPGSLIGIDISRDGSSGIEVLYSKIHRIGPEWKKYVFSFVYLQPTERFNTSFRIRGLNLASYDIDNVEVIKRIDPNLPNISPLNLNLEVFPNPVTDNVFHYRISGYIDLVPSVLNIRIFDQHGKQVFEIRTPNVNEGSINLPQLAPGIYFAQFTSGTYYATRKITIL